MLLIHHSSLCTHHCFYGGGSRGSRGSAGTPPPSTSPGKPGLIFCPARVPSCCSRFRKSASPVSKMIAVRCCASAPGVPVTSTASPFFRSAAVTVGRLRNNSCIVCPAERGGALVVVALVVVACAPVVVGCAP